MLVSARNPAPEGRAHPSALSPGDILGGRFRLESLAIEDGPTTFYSGTILAGRVPVSVEVLTGEGGDDAEAARLAFVAGARRASSLAGPRIARILHVGIGTAGHPYVVRDRLGGQTLEAVLAQRGALKVEDAVAVAVDICDALAEAHASKLVHGALGLRSVRLSFSGGEASDVLIVDLGTARATAMLTPGFGPRSRGTPCAPELLRGAELDARADVWAIGVLLHTMLAGASPFEADSPSSMSVAAAADEPPSLAGVPDGLADLVERCLSREPSARPPSVFALARELGAFTSRRADTLGRIAARAPAPRLDLDDDELPVTPVVDTPSATEVVDEQAYLALRSERATVPPPPLPVGPESSLDISVQVMPSVRDLTGPLASDDAADDEPEERTNTAAPVARSVAPPPVAPKSSAAKAPASTSRARLFGIAAVAACVALGAGLGLRFPARGEASSPAPPPAETHVSQTAAAAESPPVESPSPAKPTETAVPSAKAEPPPPVAPTPPARPTRQQTKPARAADKPARAAAPPQSSPPPAASPAPPPASPKPEATPRSSEDDLRRFLDDRR